MKSKNELEMEDERKDIEKTGRLLVTGDLHGDTAALVMIAKKMLEGDMLERSESSQNPQPYHPCSERRNPGNKTEEDFLLWRGVQH